MILLYRIAGKFRRRKLSRIGENTIFAEKTFTDCLLLPRQRMPQPQILQRKLTNSHKATKFQFPKVFSLESSPLYST